MNCAGCGKANAPFQVGQPGSQGAPMCLDCYVKFQSVQLRQAEFHERMAYAARSELNDLWESFGVPVTRLPPPPTARNNPQHVTFNSISVTDSQIATLNTGNIGAVDASLTVLRSAGHSEVAEQLKKLTEAVVTSRIIDEVTKDEILELLGALAEEATAPKDRQRKSSVKALMRRLSELVVGINAVSELWLRCRDALSALFGV